MPGGGLFECLERMASACGEDYDVFEIHPEDPRRRSPGRSARCSTPHGATNRRTRSDARPGLAVGHRFAHRAVAGGQRDGLFLAAKAAHNGEGHNHNDVGPFIVALDGRPVLIDVGVGLYTRQTFGPDRYEIWTMQSSWHDVPEVDGAAQESGREHAARRVQGLLAAVWGTCVFRIALGASRPAAQGAAHLEISPAL
ncbi:MAG TPA: heparinase II/III family protein [Streptosporangiaceae bacterium]|nr:heparinase II/III family protein [Streptosporangiaceae bacterium]